MDESFFADRHADDKLNVTYAQNCKICDEFLYLAWSTEARGRVKFEIEMDESKNGKSIYQWSNESKQFVFSPIRVQVIMPG